MGVQLAQQLTLGTRWTDALRIYAPVREGQLDLADPTQCFVVDSLDSPGVLFMVKQSKYDSRYIIVPIAWARNLFGQQGMISSLELRLKPGTDIADAKREIADIAGDSYTVKDRFEQQADVFRIMRIEKLISFVFLTFILLIACFNIIGSLSMLMIDKRQDVRTLRSLGATDGQVCDIFMLEGRMISLAGAAVGLLLGLALCWLQQEFGLISMGSSAGSFIVEAYPVSVHVGDLVIVFLTVLVVGWAAVWWPVRYLSRRLL